MSAPTCGELSCDECNARTAALTAERDQLRAIFPQICAALGNGAFCTPTVSVGFIESIPNEVQLVVAALRARAERAEADLAALGQSFDDNCRGVVKIADELATERARLDYLSTLGFEHRHHETGDHLGHEWTISSYGESEDVTLRDVIDAEMREDAK